MHARSYHWLGASPLCVVISFVWPTFCAAEPVAADPAPPALVVEPALPPAETTVIPDGSAPKGPVAPAFPPAIPSIDYGARLRAGLRLQDPSAPESIDKLTSTLDADVYFSGQIHRMFKWQFSATLSYAGTVGTPSSVTLSILDVIARFEPLPEFNIFLGRLLVIPDRYSPNGPWGLDEWFYPGIFAGAPLAVPKAGPLGRDIGTNIWGAFAGGYIKYYLGAYQLQDPALRPLFTGRLQANLIGPEPNFYQRTTYYGDKDLISFGIGGQYQKAGSVQPIAAGSMDAPLTDDYSEANADFIVEKTLGDSGTVSVEGAGYLFFGDYRNYQSLYVAAAGYMFPAVIGIGKLRPSVRYQHVQSAAPGAGASHVLDVQLSYVIMSWFARVHLGYRRTALDLGKGAVAGNMLFFGIVLADP